MSIGFRCLEYLEARQMLSAVATPALVSQPHAVASSVDGYSPAEIRHAYGFDRVRFGAAKVVGDGAGQTIAIIDAYDHPKIAADLKTFSLQFGLPDPPSFKKVSQTGSTTALPAFDASWAQEIALDVQWAHAIAPKANILLVEARTASLKDMIIAIDYARKAPGVSVVSMSWGFDEFSGQDLYDSHFTTPAGHTGVTFVAASGDDGAGSGATWPAVSSNVLSVGGTTLTLDDDDGDYLSETGWRSSSGGVSRYEEIPKYQLVVDSGENRLAPDVSYNGDPNTGFAIYDSLSYEGDVGWQVFGGTSAGTPQWAALIAIANQGRTLQGGKPLDGVTGTLPTLYSLYPKSTTYAAYYHDILTGGARPRFGRPSAVAEAGYDIVTGLGSPQSPRIIGALLNAKGGSPAKAKTATHAAVAGPTVRAAVAKVQVALPTATPDSIFSAVKLSEVAAEFDDTQSYLTASVSLSAIVPLVGRRIVGTWMVDFSGRPQRFDELPSRVESAEVSDEIRWSSASAHLDIHNDEMGSVMPQQVTVMTDMMMRAIEPRSSSSALNWAMGIVVGAVFVYSTQRRRTIFAE